MQIGYAILRLAVRFVHDLRPGYCCITGLMGGDDQVLAVDGRDMNGGDGMIGEACV